MDDSSQEKIPSSAEGTEKTPESSGAPNLEQLVASSEEKIKHMENSQITQADIEHTHESTAIPKILQDDDDEIIPGVKFALPSVSIAKQRPDGESGLQKITKFFGKGVTFMKQKINAVSTSLEQTKKSHEEKGNMFTKIFSENKSSTEVTGGSELIENIIAQSHGTEAVPDVKVPPSEVASPEEMENQKEGKLKSHERRILDLQSKKEAEKVLLDEQVKEKKGENMLQIAKIFAGISILLPITSFLFSGLFLSTEGFLSGLLGEKNYGLTLKNKTEELTRIEADIAKANSEMATLDQKVNGIQNNEVLAEIAQKRIHWNRVFEKILTLTDTTFEGNSVGRYVTYQSYSGDTATQTLKISGEVRAPTGKSFEALIKLKNALNEHPNFGGVELRQFSKRSCAEKSKISAALSCAPFFFSLKYTSDSELTLKAAPPESDPNKKPE
ncbi:hypothetical protein HZA38_03805 [Candidatus Peregrinibacteria bacterium]|nr:hypothetical protein [Candidatus Peregrinibacteria bacterium]